MDDDLLREAETIINAADIKLALKDLRDHYMPAVAETAMSLYKEYKNVGFTDDQALDVARAYTLEFCRLEFTAGDEEY